MNRRSFLAPAAGAFARVESTPALLDPESFRHFIEDFNDSFPEEVVNNIPDAHAWDFLDANIPSFTCTDREIEQLYYYRRWTYRKHIKETPEGFLITQLLKPVKHAAEYTALGCALGQSYRGGTVAARRMVTSTSGYARAKKEASARNFSRTRRCA